MLLQAATPQPVIPRSVDRSGLVRERGTANPKVIEWIDWCHLCRKEMQGTYPSNFAGAFLRFQWPIGGGKLHIHVYVNVESWAVAYSQDIILGLALQVGSEAELMMESFIKIGALYKWAVFDAPSNGCLPPCLAWSLATIPSQFWSVVRQVDSLSVGSAC